MRISLSGDLWRVCGFVPSEWRFRRVWTSDYCGALPWITATVPGDVLADLEDAGLAADWRRDRNSLTCEWVAQRDWVYERLFDFSPPPGERVWLRFSGVDYSCHVFLNGEPLGSHQGMFAFDLEATQALRDGTNRLVVVVERAPDGQPQTGHTSLSRTWKPRFAYNWDWCTRLVTAGIWEDVHIEVCDRPSDPVVTADDRFITVEAAGEVIVTDPSHREIYRGPPGRIGIEDPQLWWPNGYGTQPLYTVTTGGRSVRVGLRTIRLDGFTFKVNEVPVPVKGWNWVPLDHAYGRPHTTEYRHAVATAAQAGCNLLRVWGGGLLEREAFYDACDEAGIMVWQDFLQSSSAFDHEPASDPQYLEYATAQAQAMIRARRHHSCLALWCAGNELAAGPDRVPLDEDHPAIAALRSVAERCDPGRAWLATTPTGPEAFSKPGSRQRNVHGNYQWMGDPAHYRHYGGLDPEFQGEVGVEGAANLPTLRRALSKTWPPDDVWRFHGEWWLNPNSVEDMWGRIDDAETFVACSQWLQAEGLRTVVEAASRRWPRQSGVVLWQLNEGWPNSVCTNVLDYWGHVKPALWAVANAWGPHTISASFDRIGYEPGETITATLHASGDGALRWVWYEASSAEVLAAGRGPQATLRTGSSPAVFVLQCFLSGGERLLAENTYLFSTASPAYETLRSMPRVQLEAAQDVPGTLTVQAAGRKGPIAGLRVEPVGDHGSGVAVDRGWWWYVPSGDARQARVSGRGVVVVSALNAGPVEVEI